jgi:hypothetical protein
MHRGPKVYSGRAALIVFLYPGDAGTTAQYEQAVPLYGTFTILNGVLGGAMFFFHISAHGRTRELLNKVKNMCCPSKKK